MGYLVRLDQEERKRQKSFLKQHVNNDLRRLSPKFLKAFVDVDSGEVARDNIRLRNERRRLSRNTRSVESAGDMSNETENIDGSHGDVVHAYVEEEELKDIERQIHDIYDELHHLESASNTSHVSDSDASTSRNVTIQGEQYYIFQLSHSIY